MENISKTSGDCLIPPSSPTTSHASSVASTASSHKAHHGGVQKFCSKIRHKIEDNIAPRLTSKLYKSSHKHSISMGSLSLAADSTSGKYTDISKQATLPSQPGKVSAQAAVAANTISTVSSAHRRLTGMLKHQRQRISKTSTPKTLNKCEISAPIGEVATNTGIICPALSGKGVFTETLQLTPERPANYAASHYESGTYVDSDEEYQLSLNLTKQSLEDEIFEELERAAHDESKLNAVLKNFDRLLVDYNDEQRALVEGEVEGEARQLAQHVECDVAVVEAAAAAQLELLALEPPNAFADDVSVGMEGYGEQRALISGVKEKEGASEVAQVEAHLNAAKSAQDDSPLEVTSVERDKTAAVSEYIITQRAVPSLNDAHSNASTTTIFPEESVTAPQPPARPKRLEKSKSSLAIRNVYQSPDTPTLRNIRSALTNRARSKSVWELTAANAPLANSKIPIFKALPLQKRSKSFCSTSLTEVIDKEKLLSASTTKMLTGKQAAGAASTAATNMQRRPLTKDARTASTLSLGGAKTRSRSVSTTRAPQAGAQVQQQAATTTAQRSKRKSLPVEKLTRSNSRPQMERTKSSIGLNAATACATSAPRRTPSSSSLSGGNRGSRSSIGSQGSGGSQSANGGVARSSTAARKSPHSSRDELLDKCLEKGHEILRKVESINTEGGMRKITTGKTSSKTAAARATAATQLRRAVTTTTTTTPVSSRTKVKTTTPTTICNAAPAGKITKDACNGTVRRTRVTSTSPAAAITSNKSKTAAATKHLKYANEEKVIQPQLELCKIIPPVLGEMSDKHVELLVNVVQAKPVSASSAPPTAACKTTANKQLLKCEAANNFKEQQPFKIQETLNECAPVSALLSKHLSKVVDNSNESDSDDSGHISNENDTTIRTLSTSTASSVSLCESDVAEEEKLEESLVSNKTVSTTPSKSTKISELMEKFEKQTQASTPVQASAVEQSHARSTPTKVCTATRVAQVEAVQCIQTRVEFYPTYSKEVTIRLF